MHVHAVFIFHCSSLFGGISLPFIFVMHYSDVDRWSAKLLALPMFDEEFAMAIKGTPLANLAFVAAMEAQDASEFIQMTLSWADSWGGSRKTVFGERLVMLEQYWSFCRVSEEAFFRSTAFQIGFGMCETAGDPASKKPTWRIIPVSKWLVTTIYKPFRPFIRGITPVRGLTNHG